MKSGVGEERNEEWGTRNEEWWIMNNEWWIMKSREGEGSFPAGKSRLAFSGGETPPLRMIVYTFQSLILRSLPQTGKVAAEGWRMRWPALCKKEPSPHPPQAVPLPRLGKAWQFRTWQIARLVIEWIYKGWKKPPKPAGDAYSSRGKSYEFAREISQSIRNA